MNPQHTNPFVEGPSAPPPAAAPRKRGRPRIHPIRELAFGCVRDLLDNRFVYLVVTPRVRGLLAGVNLAPDKQCNFNCCYCEVDRSVEPRERQVDVPVMAEELERTLRFVDSGQIREHPVFGMLPVDLLKVRHVALAGDGEPTLNSNLAAAVEAITHVRAQGNLPFFKMVLFTNATTVDSDQFRAALRFFTHDDDIWMKLDAGTQPWMDRVNRPSIKLQKVLDNILSLARVRPVVIQSMFPAINGEGPPATEIEEFSHRLRELRDAGAQISLVQICSATRPTPRSDCGHLGLRALSRIAYLVHDVTGLAVEVY